MKKILLSITFALMGIVSGFAAKHTQALSLSHRATEQN